MNLWKWNSIVALLVACCAFTLAGCGGDGETDSSQDNSMDTTGNGTHDASTNDSADVDSGNSAGGDDAEYSQLTPETFQQLKDMWLVQIEGPQAQADTLRKVEAEHNDAQLKELIAQIDTKVAELRTMLDEATVANGSKTLQIDIPRVLGEAGQLVEKASTRMQEVLQQKFGGGETGGGDGG